MFQQFFTDTLVGRVVKNILSTQRLPLLDYVDDDDIIIKDCVYLYKHYVIKCHKTGRLHVPDGVLLYPSEDLYPSVILYPEGGQAIGQFNVLAIYNELENRQYTYNFISSSNYYDSDTHRFLGEYLRYLRCIKGLNLFPYYNCFNHTILDKIYLKKDGYVLNTNSDYKIYSIPIKFGKKYTIALDCATEVLCRSVIYGESGMVKSLQSKFEYYSDWPDMVASQRSIASSNFNKPFVYQIDTIEPLLYQRQKSLYLLIQVPNYNTSSIVVLEGDYTKLGMITADKKNTVRNYNQYKNLSLLQFNSHESFAFSDRLIEYLLLNVVDENDELTDNIKAVQLAVCKFNPSYELRLTLKQSILGVWDDELRKIIFDIIDKYSKNTYLVDMDGYVNKDVEKLLLREGLRIDTAH